MYLLSFLHTRSMLWQCTPESKGACLSAINISRHLGEHPSEGKVSLQRGFKTTVTVILENKYFRKNSKNIVRFFYIELKKTERQHCRFLPDSFLTDEWFPSCMYNREKKTVFIQAWEMKSRNTVKNLHPPEFYLCTSVQVHSHFWVCKCYFLCQSSGGRAGENCFFHPSSPS